MVHAVPAQYVSIAGLPHLTCYSRGLQSLRQVPRSYYHVIRHPFILRVTPEINSTSSPNHTQHDKIWLTFQLHLLEIIGLPSLTDFHLIFTSTSTSIRNHESTQRSPEHLMLFPSAREYKQGQQGGACYISTTHSKATTLITMVCAQLESQPSSKLINNYLSASVAQCLPLQFNLYISPSNHIYNIQAISPLPPVSLLASSNRTRFRATFQAQSQARAQSMQIPPQNLQRTQSPVLPRQNWFTRIYGRRWWNSSELREDSTMLVVFSASTSAVQPYSFPQSKLKYCTVMLIPMAVIDRS